MLHFLSFLRKNRAFVVGIFILALLALIAPVMANQAAWNWKDQSGLLPYRDGVGITLAAERQGQWLLSDGTRLYRFDGTTLTDLTPELRARGIYSIASLSATRNQWLIQGTALDQAGPSVWMINGTQWSDVSRLFSAGVGGFDAVGQENTWYVHTYSKATSYDPSYWTLHQWKGGLAYPTVVALPTNLSHMQAGCFTDSQQVKMCNGLAKPVFLNGSWYMIGGRMESRGSTDQVVQSAQGSIWRLDGERFSTIPNLPAFRYVSGVWQGKKQILIATSDTVTNPFAADQFWLFDGTNLENISSQALSTGLLSVDAREIKAADGGSSWMIAFGKNLVRLENDRLTSEGKSRDLFQVVSSNGNGVFVLGGLVSSLDQSFASNPLTAKLVLVQENGKTGSKPASELLSKTRGPNVSVRAIPQDGVIGDGKAFTFRAESNDPDGVAQVSIFVNGARLKTCPGTVCEYTQTYWTNGQAKREIPFFARATDKLGYASDSKTIKVTVDHASTAGSTGDQLGKQDTNGKTISLPQGTWSKDAKTGLSWIAWNNLSTSTLASHATTTYFVAAQNSRGLGRVEIWVNGEVKRACDFTSLTDIRVCSVELVGNDYPAASEVFVNAQLFTNANRETPTAWTDGMRIRRASDANNVGAVAAAAVAKPIFATTVSIDGNISEIARGGIIKVRTQSQSNTFGLKRVDVYNNVSLVRSCSFGAAVSPMPCDIEIDTSQYPAGTSVSISAKAIDGDYIELWSNTKSVFIRDQNTQTNITPSQTKDMSVWSWLTPATNELWNDQVMSYTAGAWAEHGIEKIEIIADGQLKSTCAYGAANGNKECTYVLNQGEYANNHVVIINARVTDGQGNKAWAPVSSVTVKHVWGGNYVPPYVTITSDHQTGYANGEYVTLTARGWSARQTERIQILVNGQIVSDCPSDICTWTSRALTTNQLEYQAKAFDRAGEVVWTGVIGINKK